MKQNSTIRSPALFSPRMMPSDDGSDGCSGAARRLAITPSILGWCAAIAVTVLTVANSPPYNGSFELAATRHTDDDRRRLRAFGAVAAHAAPFTSAQAATSAESDLLATATPKEEDMFISATCRTGRYHDTLTLDDAAQTDPLQDATALGQPCLKVLFVGDAITTGIAATRVSDPSLAPNDASTARPTPSAASLGGSTLSPFADTGDRSGPHAAKPRRGGGPTRPQQTTPVPSVPAGTDSYRFPLWRLLAARAAAEAAMPSHASLPFDFQFVGCTRMAHGGAPPPLHASFPSAHCGDWHLSAFEVVSALQQSQWLADSSIVAPAPSVERLLRAVDAHSPDVIVLQLGGNDLGRLLLQVEGDRKNVAFAARRRAASEATAPTADGESLPPPHPLPISENDAATPIGGEEDPIRSPMEAAPPMEDVQREDDAFVAASVASVVRDTAALLSSLSAYVHERRSRGTGPPHQLLQADPPRRCLDAVGAPYNQSRPQPLIFVVGALPTVESKHPHGRLAAAFNAQLRELISTDVRHKETVTRRRKLQRALADRCGVHASNDEPVAVPPADATCDASALRPSPSCGAASIQKSAAPDDASPAAAAWAAAASRLQRVHFVDVAADFDPARHLVLDNGFVPNRDGEVAIARAIFDAMRRAVPAYHAAFGELRASLSAMTVATTAQQHRGGGGDEKPTDGSSPTRAASTQSRIQSAADGEHGERTEGFKKHRHSDRSAATSFSGRRRRRSEWLDDEDADPLDDDEDESYRRRRHNRGRLRQKRPHDDADFDGTSRTQRPLPVWVLPLAAAAFAIILGAVCVTRAQVMSLPPASVPSAAAPVGATFARVGAAGEGSGLPVLLPRRRPSRERWRVFTNVHQQAAAEATKAAAPPSSAGQSSAGSRVERASASTPSSTGQSRGTPNIGARQLLPPQRVAGTATAATTHRTEQSGVSPPAVADSASATAAVARRPAAAESVSSAGSNQSQPRTHAARKQPSN